MAKGGLGRGLGALIPGGGNQPAELRPVPKTGRNQPPLERNDDAPGQEQAEVAGPPQTPNTTNMPLLEVPVAHIHPNEFQPRIIFNEGKLRELADSIKEHGVMQPLVVTKLTLPPLPPRPGRKPEPVQLYQLIAGERRLRAAKLAGLTTVPVIVKEASDEDRLSLALVENIQRADLGPTEEAQAYRLLIDQFNLTHEGVAKRVGKNRSTITNMLRVLDGTPETLAALSAERITMGHAVALRGITNREGELAILNKVMEEGLSVRATENLAREVEERGLSGLTSQGELRGVAVSSHTRPGPALRLNADDRAIQERFSGALGTRVEFNRNGKKGKLVIYYDDEEILQTIYEKIVGEDQGF